jgi:hypothetical protein
VAGVLGPHVDVDRPVLAELPDRLGVIRDEARFAAEQAALPLRGGLVVAHLDAGEQGEQHSLEPTDIAALPAARPAGAVGRPCRGWPLPQLATRGRPATVSTKRRSKTPIPRLTGVPEKPVDGGDGRHPAHSVIAP